MFKDKPRNEKMKPNYKQQRAKQYYERNMNRMRMCAHNSAMK